MSQLNLVSLKVVTDAGDYEVFPVHNPVTCRLPNEPGILPECHGCQVNALAEMVLDLYRPVLFIEAEPTEEDRYEEN